MSTNNNVNNYEYLLFNYEDVEENNKKKKDSDEDYVPSDEEILPEEIFVSEPKKQKIAKKQTNYDSIFKPNAKDNFRKKIKISDEHTKKLVEELLTTMRIAYEADIVSVKMEKPALKKYDLLPKVIESVNKPAMKEQFLSSALIPMLVCWLEPYTITKDNEERILLPSLSFRLELYKFIKNLQISIDYIKDYSFGYSLLRLWNYYETNEECKHIIRLIVIDLYNQFLNRGE